jgi:hypothetical protein
MLKRQPESQVAVSFGVDIGIFFNLVVDFLLRTMERLLVEETDASDWFWVFINANERSRLWLSFSRFSFIISSTFNY